jgi:hypothetical protein
MVYSSPDAPIPFSPRILPPKRERQAFHEAPRTIVAHRM